TAFTTPLALRLAPRVAAGIERRLPARIRGGLSLYAAWLDDLRRGDTTSPTRSRIRRAFQVLVIDAVVIAALTVGASIGSDWLLGQLRDRAAIDESWAGVALVVAVIVLCSPFLRGIVRAARTLGLVLGSSVFPHVDGKRADLLSTSRRAMSVGVQLVALLATAIPLAALTQPFLPPGVGLLALLVLAVPTAVYLWRSTRDLQEHVHSATGALVEALRRGIALDAEPALEDLLHGLGDATAIHLPEGAPAVGRTLAELNLRVTTGATVLGIARPGGDIAAPSGSQRLQTGDTLAVAGPQDAVRWAREALLGVSEGDGDDAPPVEPA
ncbi:MAG: TrkA C-terminal domain-containing protein, partial [Myxococcales bacterium]|nr:TrkA C-terminal domain-containing protein [Myxococcales bacterium]